MALCVCWLIKLANSHLCHTHVHKHKHRYTVGGVDNQRYIHVRSQTYKHADKRWEQMLGWHYLMLNLGLILRGHLCVKTLFPESKSIESIGVADIYILWPDKLSLWGWLGCLFQYVRRTNLAGTSVMLYICKAKFDPASPEYTEYDLTILQNSQTISLAQIIQALIVFYHPPSIFFVSVLCWLMSLVSNPISNIPMSALHLLCLHHICLLSWL